MDNAQQFLIVAGAHFLALLSPGPDFFLIVRSALVNGPRTASGACLGIALANGLYIALALGGVTLLHEASAFYSLLRWGGCLYLAWLGWRFLQTSSDTPDLGDESTGRQPANWGQEFRTGLASGLLNPKNSLFYTSLFSLGFDPATPITPRLALGAWMFFVVLAWDLGIARAAGHPPVVRRFMAHIRLIERGTGAILLALAAGIASAR